MPRRDDVRRLGQRRPRRVDPHHRAALEAGINFIDTADVYSGGESEEIVGRSLSGGRRDDVFLATEALASIGDGDFAPDEAVDVVLKTIVESIEPT
ncbi:MAG TPA: aldo/keto reductase [Solirubrobacterales bacterium]